VKNNTTHTETLLNYIKGDFDDAWFEENFSSVQDLFKSCIAREWPKEREHATMLTCGGLSTHGETEKIDDPVKSLYRLLHLVEPPKTYFDDCYKGEIFRFYSADFRCLVVVEFWKHELAIRFYCLREMLSIKKPAPAMHLRYNLPGFKNDGDRRCVDEQGAQFFEMVTIITNHECCLYGGNNFIV